MRRCPFDQTMNAFIGRRTRPSSARCRALLDVDVVGVVVLTLTAGGKAVTAGHGMSSTGVGGGDVQRLASSLITVRRVSGLCRDVIIIGGVVVAVDDDDQAPLVMALVISVATRCRPTALFCDEVFSSSLASQTLVSTLTWNDRAVVSEEG